MKNTKADIFVAERSLLSWSTDNLGSHPELPERRPRGLGLQSLLKSQEDQASIHSLPRFHPDMATQRQPRGKLQNYHDLKYVNNPKLSWSQVCKITILSWFQVCTKLSWSQVCTKLSWSQVCKNDHGLKYVQTLKLSWSQECKNSKNFHDLK